jgi:SAM-dependent methyltransferase
MFMKFFNELIKLNKKFDKLSCWAKWLIAIGMILFYIILTKKHAMENFKSKDKFISKNNNNIYDKFYAEIYDDLIFDNGKSQYEVNEIISKTGIEENDLLLDIGSGTGMHVDIFNKKGLKSEGVDRSNDMVEYSRNKFPKYKFKVGNIENNISYPSDKFSHITLLFFSIYYIKNKKQLFQNCFNWLEPGGSLIIHLVNRNKFDPVLNVSDPLQMISAQKYAKKRITSSYVRFYDMDYKADFKLDKQNDIGVFVEKIEKDSGEVRYNEHTLYMEKQSKILGMAKASGFIMKNKIDLVNVQYEYQYLYILQKPE